MSVREHLITCVTTRGGGTAFEYARGDADGLVRALASAPQGPAGHAVP
ncbi:hypothetical protein ABZ839_05110 [Streptomyces cellulosae]